MKNVLSAAIGGLFVCLLVPASAVTYTEDFSHDPSLDGWQVFGDTNLFQWNSTNHLLDVTWDSLQPNSYFYLPLNGMVTKNDDFSFSFDLKLSQASTNDGTGPLQLALGFLNLTNAMDPGFLRGAGYCPDIAEFDYYPDGFFPPSYPSPASAAPSFVDDTSSVFAPSDVSAYEVELPTNVLMHISMNYTGTNQTAVLCIETNGMPLVELPPLIVNTNGNGQFTEPDNFYVNMFSVTSYSEAGQYPPYVSSIFAKGTVGNLIINVPPPAQDLSIVVSSNICNVQFQNHLGWLYTLQRSTDLMSWADASDSMAGNGTNLVISDVSAPAAGAFYRISATRP